MALQPAYIQNCNPPPPLSVLPVQMVTLFSLYSIYGCTIFPVPMVALPLLYQRLHYHSCTCRCTCNCTNGCSILTVYHNLKVPACTNGCSIRSVPTVPLSFLTKWLFLLFLSFSTNSSSIFPLPMVVPFILYQWFFYPPCTNVCSIYSLPLVPVPVFVPFILYHWFQYQCLFH